jgi:hypothetical protein
MSFQDVAPLRPVGNRRVSPPRIVVQSPENPKAESKRKTRRIVLHGKVQHVECSDNEEAAESLPRESIRERMQRRSDFSQLAHETQQFQKMVSELSSLLDESGETPESSWRARILVRSAQETDKDLWDKLYNYEKTLLIRGKNAEELRTAQTSCMKLHRDFKRSNKTLLMALSTFEKRQAAEVSRLGAVGCAVGWSSSRGEEKTEDFFDRAMREREEELERMNKSMHQVNDIYKDLAALVEGQQADIDRLEDDVQYSRANVEAAVEEDIGCLDFREHFCGAFELDFVQSEWAPFPNFENDIVLHEEKTSDSGSPPKNSRSSKVRRQIAEEVHWYTPFETFPEDLKSVKSDIVGLGKEVITKSKHFDCS